MKKSQLKQIITQQLNKLLSLNQVKSRQQIRKQKFYIHRNINPNNEDFSYLLWDKDLSYQDLKKYCQKQQVRKDIEKNKEDYLFDSIKKNHIELFKILLDQFNVDVNKKKEDGQFPLHQACQKNLIQIVKILLKHPKIDINLQTKLGWTSLHIVCQLNNIQIAKLLLNHPKIDVNVKNKFRQTPLHYACWRNNIQMTKLLLKFPEINPNINTNIQGKTPIEMTKNRQIKKLIKNHLNYKGI